VTFPWNGFNLDGVFLGFSFSEIRRLDTCVDLGIDSEIGLFHFHKKKSFKSYDLLKDFYFSMNPSKQISVHQFDCPHSFYFGLF